MSAARQRGRRASRFFFDGNWPREAISTAPRWRSPNPPRAFFSRSDPSSVSSLAHSVGLAQEREERELGPRSYSGSLGKRARCSLHRLLESGSKGSAERAPSSSFVSVSIFVLFRRRFDLFPSISSSSLALRRSIAIRSSPERAETSPKRTQKSPQTSLSLTTHHARQDVPGHGRRRV